MAKGGNGKGGGNGNGPPEDKNENNDVQNIRVEDEKFEFGRFVEGEFSGHLNIKEGDNPHVVGQGEVDLEFLGFPVAEDLRVNFVINEHVTNVVAHTDEGVIHFNSHSGGSNDFDFL